MNYYAGIGSRKTPGPIIEKIKKIATILSKKYTLRSGGAQGADSAFEVNSPNAEIFLPRSTFNGRISDGKIYINYRTLPAAELAMETVWKYHPKPDKLNDYSFDLMARNAMQIFGKNMDDPVEFVVCWTEGGEIKGGTGQALRIAKDHNIPVFNLGELEWKKKLIEYLHQPLTKLMRG